ncbi:hypothetical protein GQ44DRAFT_715674 [Phaeosphaeriaceae sp. PMI808]|nr:hypothetical protein GQ44DRAFT_715674 [Phaeosphaeriaceae sp. PMI808]
MHPALLFALQNADKYRQFVAPLLFTVFASTANIHVPVQHSLFITAVSWAIVWLPTLFKVGLWANTGRKRRNASWLAGAFLAFALICDRAACDKEGTWATKSLLPLLVFLVSSNELLPKLTALPLHHATHDDDAKEASSLSDSLSHGGSFRLLAVITVSAGAVLAIYAVPSTSALGISSALFAATGLVLFERAARGVEDDEQQLATLRDAAFILTIICGLASILVEPSMHGAVSWEPVTAYLDKDWKMVHDFRVLQRILWMIPVHGVINVFTFIILSQHGATHTSLLTLFACICAKLQFSPSFSNICFTIIYILATFSYMFSASSSTLSVDKRTSLRIVRRITFGATALSIGLLLFRYASGVHHHRNLANSPPLPILPPPSPFEPIPIDLSKGHPAEQLVSAAEKDFQHVLDRQSKTLAQAVIEYRRRYGIAPPPHFDKWYEFAVRNDVVMIDEYDTIYEMLMPFWALKPSTIRSRITRELGGEDSALLGVSIRNGEVVHMEKGDEWQQQATTGMMSKFVQYLPDMDLGFNIHDEPRVVVPENLMSSMVNKARNEVLPRAAKNSSPRNAFSARPEDMNDGKSFVETYVSRFNRFAHQQTWTHSRLSCPADSQSQTFEDYAPDNLTAYAAGPLNYVYNTTAFSDICISPSLSSTFGFFERPNAFNIIHELTPVFSQSKISSFQDILYPSPWYWVGKVTYDPTHDTTWENKTNALYWRGSTTGGFSRNGGWRRQHRQHIVQRLNAPDKAQIVTPSPSTPTHTLTTINRRSLKHLIDVHFSHVGQCDPGDCDAQREFFHVTEHAPTQDAWSFKHLLDMDGNAFSGRFYAFLASRSLTFKMAVFREWHTEWLMPWVHYVPLSLRGDEHLDLVNWFAEGGGKEVGKGVAERSSEWHGRVLRNVDFETWFFRCLLEYARVVDDRREEIGYAGP